MQGTQVSQIYRIIQTLCLKPKKGMCNTLTIEIKHAEYQKIIKITVIYRNSSVSRNVMIGSWLFFLVQKQCVCITTELHTNTPMQSLLII